VNLRKTQHQERREERREEYVIIRSHV
jgi:hypothetical protein